jgi:hypothetical protein
MGVDRTDQQILELLIHTMRAAEKKRARYKYFELHVCHSCFHRYVTDYMVLGFASEKYRRCELCGLEQPYPLFELLFAKTTKRRVES